MSTTPCKPPAPITVIMAVESWQAPIHFSAFFSRISAAHNGQRWMGGGKEGVKAINGGDARGRRRFVVAAAALCKRRSHRACS